MKLVTMKMIKTLMINTTLTMTINTIVTTMPNLIFEAGGPRLEMSSVRLFDRLETDSIRSRLLLRHLLVKVHGHGHGHLDMFFSSTDLLMSISISFC